jgi:hypothetical protein
LLLVEQLQLKLFDELTRQCFQGGGHVAAGDGAAGCL